MFQIWLNSDKNILILHEELWTKFTGRDIKFQKSNFLQHLVILYCWQWLASLQIHRNIIVDFTWQQLLNKNATILSYIHITDFVILAFFCQEVLFMTYYWSYLNKQLSIFSSSYKTAKFFTQKNQKLHTSPPPNATTCPLWTSWSSLLGMAGV